MLIVNDDFWKALVEFTKVVCENFQFCRAWELKAIYNLEAEDIFCQRFRIAAFDYNGEGYLVQLFPNRMEIAYRQQLSLV